MNTIDQFQNYPTENLNLGMIRHAAEIRELPPPYLLDDSDMIEIITVMNPDADYRQKKTQKRRHDSVFPSNPIDEPEEKRTDFFPDSSPIIEKSLTPPLSPKPNSASVFSCPHCSHTTNRADNLRLHIRKHIDERPFICPHLIQKHGQWYRCKNHSKRQGDYQKHATQLHYTPSVNRVDKVLKSGRQFQLKPGHRIMDSATYSEILKDNEPFLEEIAKKINTRRVAIRNSARINNDSDMLDAVRKGYLPDMETVYKRGDSVDDIFGNPRIVFCDVELDLRDFEFGDKLNIVL